jgi:hypothetical protein
MAILRRLALIVAVVACERVPGRQATRATADLAELWQEPTDLEQRDLFYGPGGRAHEPDSNGSFTLVKLKEKGTNPGYDLVDERGREWAVKLGREARVEVAISRVLWAVGYHQPSIYYVRRWTMAGNEQPEGRFRLEGDSLQKKSDWSWRENPFLGTREFAGLYALMVLFSNWDLKTVQNVIYEVGKDSATLRRRYVVKDLGGALGWSGHLLHTKGDTAGFDSEPFITDVDDSVVTFGKFREGWPDSLRQDVVVKVADLRWICGLLERLSAKQWRDAFRAGGFSDAQAERFIRRLKTKIADGLAIAA